MNGIAATVPKDLLLLALQRRRAASVMLYALAFAISVVVLGIKRIKKSVFRQTFKELRFRLSFCFCFLPSFEGAFPLRVAVRSKIKLRLNRFWSVC